jgi:hypothetical protein
MLLLAACGDWTAGDSSNDDLFHGRFHYFYSSEFSYDSHGPYDCTEVYSMSPHMTVDLRIEYDGFASLRIDDETGRYYEPEYSQGYDHGRYYYQFYDGNLEITVYADGEELIILDTWDGKAYYYYYDMF